MAASRQSPTLDEEEAGEENATSDLILEKEEYADGQSVVDQPDAGYMSREGSPSALSEPLPTCAAAAQSDDRTLALRLRHATGSLLFFRNFFVVRLVLGTREESA